MNKQQIQRAAIDAVNAGGYVTIISWVRLTSGRDIIHGLTYKNCNLQVGKYTD